MSLNLDPVKDQKGAFFADLRGLKANVILFQDHRLRSAGGRKFVIGASEKVFRAKKGRLCAVVSDPPAPNGQLYGGAMVTVHPYYSGRAVAKFYDNRGLGRCAATTLREGGGTESPLSQPTSHPRLAESVVRRQYNNGI